MLDKPKHKNRPKRRRAKSEFIAKMKSKPCADCGIQYHPVSMQFDHINSDKEFNVSDGPRRDLSYERIKNEIAKCIVVCSNCHHLRSFARAKNLDIELFFAQNGGEFNGHKKKVAAKRKRIINTLIPLSIAALAMLYNYRLSWAVL